MKQNYFVCNGNKYVAGTAVKIKQHDTVACKPYETEAVFVNYDTERNTYTLQVGNCLSHYPEKMFYNILVSVTSRIDVQCANMAGQKNKQEIKQLTIENELNIDGMLIAWIWYIFVMLVGIIFYDRVMIWIFSSIIFFKYRNKKLREAGYK